MTKLPFILGTGIALFAVSCEPLPVYPENNRRPRPGNYDDRYDQRDGYDQRDRGDQRDDRYGNRNEDRYDDYRDNGRDQRPPVAPQPTRDQYPLAERTNNPNQVLSPYSPYNVIDVEGFRPGQLAKDPSNGKIFRVP